MAQTSISDTELADKSGKNNLNKVNTNSEVQNEPEPISLAKKIKKFIAFFTVEPFLILYLFPSLISSTALQKLNLEKACRSDLGYLESICIAVSTGGFNETIYGNASKESQILITDMNVWKQPIQSGFPAIIILFVGAWSDKTGNRKALMLIPILGEFVSVTGLILTTYFFEWPVWINGLIEAIPPAFSGGLPVALMGSFSYIADITSVESRTFRIGLVSVIVTLSFPIGSAISGVLTESIGYFGIFGIDILLSVIGLIYVYLRIEDVKSQPLGHSYLEKIIQFFNPKNAWDTLSILFLYRGQQLIKIIFVVVAHILIIGPVSGEASLQYYYFLYKFAMGLSEFGYFLTYSILLGLAGVTVAIAVFSKWLQIHDAIIGMIAATSKVAGTFMYALAPTKAWLYSAPVIDFFGNTSSPAIRSLGTKVVPAEKVGQMCSLIGFVEAVLPVVYGPLYSIVYSRTLDTYPGAFYLVGAFMTSPAILVFISLYCMHRQQEKDTVKNPAQKEIHAHDNAVTVL